MTNTSDPEDLRGLLDQWPASPQRAIVATDPDRTLGAGGDTTAVTRVASISKVIVGLTALVAIEEGTIDLDDPAGPPGATVRHLLAHASGLAFDEHTSIAAVGTRRIYSNAGIEQFAHHLEQRAGMTYAAYQHEAVLVPLGLHHTELRGSPAADVYSSLDDLLVLARELLRPTLVDASTFAQAITPQFPDLRGVVPGLGSFDPNPWGLGMEIRGHKSPHWTAPTNSPSTFGHFGGTGTYLWVDPVAALACVAVSGTDFGPWALDVWPQTNQVVLDRYR